MQLVLQILIHFKYFIKGPSNTEDYNFLGKTIYKLSFN